MSLFATSPRIAYGLLATVAIVIVAFFVLPSATDGQTLLEGIYCGKQNCYDVLNMTRESTRSEISKAYRKLAKQFHPDVQRGDSAARAESEEQFKLVATAYEILKDDESRKEFDYMLDNPHEYYAHYYRYYRRRVSPKVDVRLVLIVAISIISAIQYFSAWQRYDDAIRHFLTVPKYRNKAMEIIQQREKQQQQQQRGNGAAANGNGHSGGQGTTNGTNTAATTATAKKGKSSEKLSKAELRERAEQQLRQVIEENMDIKGAYAKPSWHDVLWVQLAKAPYTLACWAAWHADWTWRYTICGQPFGREQQLYVIRRLLGMGVHQFDAIDDDEKEDYLELELWDKERFAEWKQQQEEEQAKSMADNARHKQYRRYMKNHGAGRMTFDD